MEAHSEPTKHGDGRTPDRVALLERFRAQMLATARRYSINSHDADDAYQRAAEILLTHSPTGSEDELCRWLRTTVKHEALAIRRQVDRVAPAGEPQQLPEPRAAPRETAHDEAVRGERLSLGAQALGRLKPQELRCLLLKAEGYSYQEICERTGYSYTKVNRCLSEGRRAFLARVTSIESGAECDLLAPQLSALADGEGTAVDLAAVRPHLKSCLACRARLREFRAVPARVAGLAPAGVIVGGEGAGSVRSLFESLLGSAQHKASVLGDRAHQVLELAGGQKAAAVAASAAALAGGGAVTADRFSERAGDRSSPAKVRRASQGLPSGGGEAAPAPPPAYTAPPSPTAAPTPPPPAPDPQPQPQPPPVEAPPPRPSNEFAPKAAAASPPPSSQPAPVPAPSEVGSGGGGPSGSGGNGPSGSGEFAP